jgi:hypothetical protein
MYTEVRPETHRFSQPGESDPRLPSRQALIGGPPVRKGRRQLQSGGYPVTSGISELLIPKKLPEWVRKYLDSIDMPVRKCFASSMTAERPSTATKHASDIGNAGPGKRVVVELSMKTRNCPEFLKRASYRQDKIFAAFSGPLSPSIHVEGPSTQSKNLFARRKPGSCAGGANGKVFGRDVKDRKV